MAGRAEHAREVVERAITHVNDLGLLAEEVDPHSGELLGNFPQAFSHIGLVDAGWAIAEAEQRASVSSERPASSLPGLDGVAPELLAHGGDQPVGVSELVA